MKIPEQKEHIEFCVLKAKGYSDDLAYATAFNSEGLKNNRISAQRLKIYAEYIEHLRGIYNEGIIEGIRKEGEDYAAQTAKMDMEILKHLHGEILKQAVKYKDADGKEQVKINTPADKERLVNGYVKVRALNAPTTQIVNNVTATAATNLTPLFSKGISIPSEGDE